MQICEISGFAIFENEAFINMKVNEHYHVTFSKLGSSILLCSAKGDMSKSNIVVYYELREKAIQHYFGKSARIVEIKDYTELYNFPTVEERNYQIEKAKEESQRLLGYVVFSLSALMKTVFKSALEIVDNLPKYPVIIAENYAEAIEKALQLIDGACYEEQIDDNKEIVIRKSDLNKLRNRLNSISWLGSNISKSNDYPIPNELHELYDVVDLIEKDYGLSLVKLKEKNEDLQRMSTLLQQNNQLLNMIIESVKVGIILIQIDTKKIINCNEYICKLLSLTKEQLFNKKCSEIICSTRESDICFCKEQLNKNEHECNINGRFVLKNVTAILLNNEEHVIMSLVDISERKLIEKKNRIYQTNLLLLSNCSTDLVLLKNSTSILKYLGRGISEFIPNSMVIVAKATENDKQLQVIELISKQKQPSKEYIDKFFYIHNDTLNETLHKSLHAFQVDIESIPLLIKDICSYTSYSNIYASGMHYDTNLYGIVFFALNEEKIENENIVNAFINQAAMHVYKKNLEETLILQKETAESNLKNKEILLKEVHHRVKNNMAVISSLLKLQSSIVKDPALEKAFTESRNRIKSMALVHEKLYDGGDLEKINFQDYIKTLVNHLVSSYRQVYVKTQISAHNISINLDTAISLGLILNEIITNSLKYAFSDTTRWEDGSDEPLIYVIVTETDHTIEIKIGDNGVGVPQKYDLGKTDSLGMELVLSLCQQIEADITLQRVDGTHYIIRFSNAI
ncbi:MAG: PAS domain S-box protein [Bacteroidales bacterium]|nr:PAS domain S-box protein [Bacteroidales bacterium]